MDAKNAQALLEPFPQLIRETSIDTVAARCDALVECTSTRNHGHLLTSRFTGEPVEVDNSVLDPRMTVRWKRNWYYPHLKCTRTQPRALLPAAKGLAGCALAETPGMNRMVAEQSTETTVSTFCRICEARCGIDVTVRDGRVLRIGPDKLNPVLLARTSAPKAGRPAKSSITLGGCCRRCGGSTMDTSGPRGRTRSTTSRRG